MAKMLSSPLSLIHSCRNSYQEYLVGHVCSFFSVAAATSIAAAASRLMIERGEMFFLYVEGARPLLFAGLVNCWDQGRDAIAVLSLYTYISLRELLFWQLTTSTALPFAGQA